MNLTRSNAVLLLIKRYSFMKLLEESHSQERKNGAIRLRYFQIQRHVFSSSRLPVEIARSIPLDREYRRNFLCENWAGESLKIWNLTNEQITCFEERTGWHPDYISVLFVCVKMDVVLCRTDTPALNFRDEALGAYTMQIKRPRIDGYLANTLDVAS